MRLMLLLIALLIVGLLVNQQLSQTAREPQPQTGDQATSSELPQIPTRPQELQQFKQDMDNYMQDAAAERAEKLEKFEQGFTR